MNLTTPLNRPISLFSLLHLLGARNLTAVSLSYFLSCNLTSQFISFGLQLYILITTSTLSFHPPSPFPYFFLSFFPFFLSFHLPYFPLYFLPPTFSTFSPYFFPPILISFILSFFLQYDSLKRNRDGWLFPGAITLSGVCADMNVGGYHQKLPPEGGKMSFSPAIK